MAAYPPDRLRTGEVDLRHIVGDPEIDVQPAPAEVSGRANEPDSSGGSGNNLLRIYEHSWVGWSDLSNVIFAALTVIGAFFCTLHIFDSSELVRVGRARQNEYLYPPPTNSADQRQHDRNSGQSSSPPTYAPRTTPSVTAANSPSSSDRSGRFPADSTPFANQRSASRSSAASRARQNGSSATNRSRSARAIASRSRMSRSARGSHVAHNTPKSSTRSLRVPINGPAKKNIGTSALRGHPTQAMAARPLASAMKSGTAILRGSAINFSGLGRESGTREVMRHERGAAARR